MCHRKIKTIAGRLLRDFRRSGEDGAVLLYAEELALIERVLQQKRHDKNKVYSLPDPDVLCIAKGKAHKRYEFGRKASVAMLRDNGVIVPAVSFKENLYDGDTLEPALGQASIMSGKIFDSVLVDKGYRGPKNVGGTDVVIPSKINKKSVYITGKKQRKRNGRRPAVEPVIGHMKNGHRMARCFLKGAEGAGLNLILAAAAWNIKKWLNGLPFTLILWLRRINRKADQILSTRFLIGSESRIVLLKEQLFTSCRSSIQGRSPA
jgi:IS5 family transposase